MKNAIILIGLFHFILIENGICQEQESFFQEGNLNILNNNELNVQDSAFIVGIDKVLNVYKISNNLADRIAVSIYINPQEDLPCVVINNINSIVNVFGSKNIKSYKVEFDFYFDDPLPFLLDKKYQFYTMIGVIGPVSSSEDDQN